MYSKEKDQSEILNAASSNLNISEAVIYQESGVSSFYGAPTEGWTVIGNAQYFD